MQDKGKSNSGNDMQVTSVNINPDGSITREMASGTKITKDARGNVVIEHKILRAVGIKHLGEVESHTIHTVMGSTSHYIRFHGGGEVQYAYSNTTGKLIELSSKKLGSRVSHEGEVLFFSIPEN